MLDEWNWTIGEVVSTFGLVGEMKVRIESDFPERFAALEKVCLRPPKAAPRVFNIQRTRLHKGQLLLTVEGVGSIGEAQSWRGALVQIKKAEAVPLPENSFYAADLVGMEVVTTEGRLLGKLEKILPYPAQDLFQIGEILIPAVKEIVVQVDVPGRQIVVDPPAGILPGETPEEA